MRSLRLANKRIRNLIDGNETSKIIIPQVARQAHLYEWETALALRTIGVKNLLQRSYTFENNDSKVYEFKDLKTYFDEHLFESNPSPEKLKRIRFLIHCFPPITEIGKSPALTLGGPKDPDVVRNLIAAGMNVNHRDHRTATPLMQACIVKDLSTVRLLLAAGADISIRTNNDKDAIHCAQLPILVANLQIFPLPVIAPGGNNFTESKIAEKTEILRLLEEAKNRQESERKIQEQAKQGCSIQ